MKVALIPLAYEPINFGCILQSIALQKALSVIGAESEILQVNDDTVLCQQKPKKNWRYFARKMVAPFRKCHKMQDKRVIQSALQNRYRRTAEYRKRAYVKTVNINDVDLYAYDAVICGSDQIWNPTRARARAFLGFVPDDITKVIYAASMGCETITEYQKQCFKPLVERLDFVSVREKSAKVMLDSFVERKNISVQLDPTLLLLQEEWDTLVGEIPPAVRGKKYLLTYFLGDYSKQTKTIAEYAKKQNLQIVNIPFASGERVDKTDFGDISVIDATPDEFVAMVKHADCVFTDSFHACVFSIIYEKPFFAYKRDGSSRMMGRITTLLQTFHISESRIVSPECSFETCEPIDYSFKQGNHDRLREESLDFLRKALHQKGRKGQEKR